MADQVAHDVQAAIKEILTAGEQVLAVAPQDPRSPSLRKAAAVATTNRFILYQPQVVGSFKFDDVPWYEVDDVHLKQGMLFSDLSVRKTDGTVVVAEKLAKDAARRLYTVCQQHEEEWHEKRRQRQMEEDRARAGGVVIGAQQPAQPVADEPVARLAKLKSMLDAGLITEVEYNETKQRILASL